MNFKKIIKKTAIAITCIVLFLFASCFIQVNKNEDLFYKIQQYVTYNDADWANYEKNKKLDAEYLEKYKNLTNTTDVLAEAPADLYPYNINRFQGADKEQELTRIKNAHFENLKIATKKPNNDDGQTALCNFTQGKLTDAIISQKLNIKIGTCYENPNTDGNFNCVSCMVLLFNTEKNDWQEAPDGDNFMKVAYDFYQTSENDIWEAKDLSIAIPYDYGLFKKFTLKE